MKKNNKINQDEITIGPVKGDFIAPPEMTDVDERTDALPQQEEFWKPPTRFGSVPVEKEPLGWDRRKGFRKLFPQVMLPFQVVERVSFGHPKLEPNRLFWGDNLHVMRQLPSESIDLIYIDPPFFSGRQYNVIFGDQNELRSFSDIWEGGMPGYLIWLNARLYEMKRLLKKTGSIYVHCDWHASHYIKIEMDKIFGHECFINEIIWQRTNTHNESNQYGRVHDTILFYSKGNQYVWNPERVPFSEAQMKRYKRDATGRWYTCQDMTAERRNSNSGKFKWRGTMPGSGRGWGYTIEQLEKWWADGRIAKKRDGTPRLDGLIVYLDEMPGKAPQTIWTDVPRVANTSKERIGYPTQKSECLMQRIIVTSSNEGDVVADFFCGGGTTAAVAQRLSRRWIACDQSRVAVAITADRLARGAEQLLLDHVIKPIPDFTVEHWGIYEARRLADAPPDQFRAFVLRAFGAVIEEHEAGIHGYKGAIPVWVGEPDQKKAVTAKDVQDFANSMRKTLRYKQDNLRDGIMLAWAFRPDAVEAADRLRKLEQTDLNFIRLDMIRIDSPRFREHVTALSTDHADYENFLTFVQPPKVEVGYKRIAVRTYKFDVSESVVMNMGAKIINVQWDFQYEKRFSSTPGYSFARTGKQEVALQVQYEFPSVGKQTIACKVQDDMGGEGLWTTEIEVS